MKGVRHLRGLREIKTLRSIRARSIPRSQRSDYLELYTLVTEKERLEKELAALEKNRKIVKKKLEGVDNCIGKLQQAHQEGKVETSVKNPKYSLKTMSIAY